MNIATGLKKVRQSIAVFSLAAMLMSMVAVNVANAAFADVPSDAWYGPSFEEAVQLGIMDGTKQNARPGDYATRSEAIKTLIEAAGITKDDTGVKVCSDSNEKEWDYIYLQTAVNNGIMNGYGNGKCGGKDPVTRGQFAKLLVNAMSLGDKMPKSAPSFSDVSTDNVFYKPIENATYWSVVKGYADGTFGWMKNIQRSELFTMVIRGLNPVPVDGVSADTFTVVSANPTSASQVDVMFSMDVEATTGAMAANYTIKDNEMNNLPVTAAVVSGNKVTLTTGTQTVNKAYTVTVSGVTSSAAKALEGATANFTGFNVVGTGGDLTVALDSSTPALTTLVTKTANNPLMALNLTAGADKASQVTGITVKKLGFYNDSSVKVVAYDSNGVRISSGVTFSDGMASVTFTSPVTVAAGSSVKVWLKVSISGTASGTLGISIDTKDAVAANSTNISATWPISSPVDNVVDGTPSVAAATVDVTSISTTTRTVDIGEKNYELTKFEIAETSSKEDLKLMGLTLFNNGSVADGDVQNYVLKDQTGAVLATTKDQKNKLVYFDLSANPYLLQKGATRLFSVFVDVVNGATRTAQLIVQNDFDVLLRGASTGADILATAQAGGTDTSFPIGDVASESAGYNHITINEGQLTISRANTSPSGEITIGAPEQVLGSFEVKASGEDIELQRIKIDLSSQTTTLDAVQDKTGSMECVSASSCDLVGSIKVMVDDNLDGKGDRTLLTTSAAPTTLGDLWDADALANYDFSSFYTVGAGKTVNLLIVGNITSNGDITGAGETIKVGVAGLYHYKKSSLKYGTAADGALPGAIVTGNQLNVSTSALTVSKNVQYGNQTVVAQSNAKVGSFIVKAGSAEGINVTSITIKGGTTCGGAGDVDGYTNVKLMKAVTTAGVTTWTQLGSTKASVTFNGGQAGDTSNTYSVSGLNLAAGEQAMIDVYADMNTSATDLCLDIPINGISGTGVGSITSITGPSAALDLQLISATANGTLTVSVANDTPVSRQYVAGTTDNQVLLVKLSSNNAEDLYIKKLQFRVTDATADVAVAQATLKYGTTVNGLTTMTPTLGWQDDSTNPGLVEWTFSGANRPKVVKNGTLYAGLYIDFSSSSEQAVTGKQPQFVLTNVEAEGLATLSPSNANPVGPIVVGTNLIMATGILPQVGGTAATNNTFVDSTVNTDAAISSATATTVVTDGGTFVTGDIIFIDQDASGDWDPATEELMTVVSDGGTDLTVIRGAFGTTAQAAYSTAKNIYVLNTANLAGTNNLVGNNNVTFNTKPLFAVNPASPTGATAAANQKLVFKFDVQAVPNNMDSAENKVSLTYVNITTNKSGTTVNNLQVYPGDHDLDSTYATSCVSLTATKWRCTLSTVGATNEVVEGTTKTFNVYGDVGSTGTTSALEVYIASLGGISTTGDVSWSDGTTSSTWVYQPGATQIKPASAMSFGAASNGDTTAPTLSSITFVDATADNALTVGATIALTFSERMDPTTIGSASLIPNGSAVAITNGATGDLSATNNSAASGNDMLVITNIVNVDLGATTFVTTTVNAADTATLDTTGTILTLSVTSALTGAGADGTEIVEPGSFATTVKDVNSVPAVATGANSATVSGVDL